VVAETAALEVRRRVDAGSLAAIDPDPSAPHACAVVARQSHDDVPVTVGVDVAGERHAAACARAVGRARDRDHGENAEAGDRAAVDQRLARRDHAAGRSPRRAEDDVRIRVAVDVARARDRGAQARVDLVALERERRHGGERALPAGIEVRRALVRLPVREPRRADDDLGNEVAVDVAGGRRRGAKVRARHVVEERDVGRRRGDRRAAVEDEHRAPRRRVPAGRRTARRR
jgi:hypothetical protein